MHTMTLEKGLATFINALSGKNRSAATIRAYQTDIQQLLSFLHETNVSIQTPADGDKVDVVEYLSVLAKRELTGIARARKMSAIREYFRFLGYALKAGHPLEDSCQEGKRPPYTPFCIFCRGMSLGISLPICRLARTRVFSGCDVDRLGATHQTPIRIKALYGCLTMWPGIRPLARHVPQKTLGTLPCPIVTSTVHMALP